jgi:hypothetical protein
MLSRSLVLSSVILSSLLLPSCDKDDNTRDIPGPAGVDGKNGEDGKNGRDGVNGVNGVAAVVYDSFDSTQTCSQNGQLIFVNSDLSFFVCRDSKWDRLLIKGKDGEAGAAGKDGIITVETRLSDSCSENGQLLYDTNAKKYYSCQNKAWQPIALNGAKGDKGDDGVAVVVMGDFNPAQSCSRAGQFVYSTATKTFYLCQSSTWTALDLKGPKGDTGAPGSNGQTLFVETADQLPACKESNMGVLYILKKSGDIRACTSSASVYSWVTVYQAPASLAQGDQSMIQDCMRADEKSWDMYRYLIHSLSVANSGTSRDIVCEALAKKAANLESLYLDSFVEHYASVSGDFLCGRGSTTCYLSTRLDDSNAYILKYLVNLKVLTIDSATVSSLSLIPSLPLLKSLTIESLSRGVVNFGDLKNLMTLNTLKLSGGYVAASNGDSGLLAITNLAKNLNVLALSEMNLTKRDLVEVAKLPNLIELNIQGNPLSDLSPLASMNSLANLKYTGAIALCPFTEVARCKY